MKIRYYILIALSITLFSCATKKASQDTSKHNEELSKQDLANSALSFAENVLNENLRVRFHERERTSYLDVQMIFETDNFVTDNFISYTSYSNNQFPDKSAKSNYDGFILFVATYKNQKSAEFAFQKLKTNAQTRISELEGFAGLFVEQVQVFERIRKHGGLITQKDKFVFFLPETCEDPPIGSNWNDYEKFFLEYIYEKNEEIEVLNADCEKDLFLFEKSSLY